MLQIKLYKELLTANGKLALDIDFSIVEGGLITITGPSGSGKTTILRILSGLLKPDKGIIKIDDEIWLDTEKKINCSPQKRMLGYVFQDYTLFPHLTVKQNLLFALDDKKDKKSVDELIGIMELKELENRKPNTLSGGQQQRVALARVLVRKPKLLLLDEPLSALDTEMRLKLQEYILKVHQQYNLTTILVSHDISEIFKMASQVIKLKDGKIIAKGTSDEVFSEQYVSGKFRFTGVIIKIEKNEVINIVNILVGNNIVKVISTDEEIKDITVGDKVMLVSKAFNPLIIKINS